MSRRRIASLLWSIAALAAAGSATAQTVFVRDTFTTVASVLLEAHLPDTGGAWARLSGTQGIRVLAATDNIQNVLGDDVNRYSNAAIPPASEYNLGITVTYTGPSPNAFVELIGRRDILTGDSYRARVRGNGTVELESVVGGVTTVLATGSTSLAIDVAHSIVFSIRNSSKEIYVNGALLASSTDNTVTGAGLVGLGLRRPDDNFTRADNFFAGTVAPTAVDKLEATALRDDARTVIEWSTAREVRNLGFRIHRGDRGERVQISRGIIGGAAFLVAGASLPAGHTYRFVDDQPQARKGRAYWIEEIDLNGHVVWHGPIVARAGVIDERVASSPSLTELGQRDGIDSVTRLRPTALAQSTERKELAKQWDLAAGAAIRIGVREEAMHRVPLAELAAAGLDPAIDPRKLRLYAGGSEVAITIDGDAILFYGTPLDTTSTDTRIYWLTSGGAGERMDDHVSRNAPPSTQRNFLATAERADKLFFVASDLDPNSDGFIGPIVSRDHANPTRQVLRLRNADAKAPAALTVRMFGATDVDGDAGHRVAVSLNGALLGEMGFDGRTKASATFDVAPGGIVDGDNVVSLVATGGELASAVLSVALTFAHTFRADEDRLLAVVEGGRQITFSGFSAGDVRLFDVTDAAAPIRIEPLRAGGGSVTFTPPGSGMRTVLAISAARFGRAASLTKNEPSSLHRAHGADVVVITHPTFAGALAPLAELRRSQGLSVEIASITDVYDEFSFGAKDPRAIRAYLENARGRKQAPRYVLLVGDASFDRRNYLGFGDFDLVPTELVIAELLRTASDTALADFDGDGAPDVPIGRLPVRTLDDARVEVQKIVTYETTPVAPTRRKIVFVSDADPSIDFHSAAVRLRESVPPQFEVVDLDVSREGVIAIRQQLLNSFGDASVIDYVGHGSVEVWSQNTLLERDDAATLPVNDTPPVVIAMTCLNGYFHDLFSESLAEALMRARGGAVAVWASSALTTPEAQIPANQALLRALLGATENVRLGDAVVAAQKSSGTPDIRRTFILFGDPATRLR